MADTKSKSYDEGMLSAYTDIKKDAIRAKQLSDMLSEHVPRGTETLIIFSQCFGGNMATSSHFKDRPNTCVLSATSKGQESAYGGYHYDAARALKLGTGRSARSRTAKDVHDKGFKGRALPYRRGSGAAASWNEKPLTAGKILPKNFSLAPTSRNGPIHSRHIVVYAGKPDSKRVRLITRNGVSKVVTGRPNRMIYDTKDRDAIKTAFHRKYQTTVETVGGKPDPSNSKLGVDGWMRPGTKDGLEAAIKSAGALIKRSAARGKKEQLILFFSDHGIGTTVAEYLRAKKARANTRTSMMERFEPFPRESSYANAIERNPEALPGFEIRIDPSRSVFDLNSGPDIGPNDLILEFSSNQLKSFEWYATSWDNKEPVGSHPDDELVLFFPMERNAFLETAIGEPYELALVNNSNEDLTILSISQLTGDIEKHTEMPERSGFESMLDRIFSSLFGWLSK